LYKTNIIIFSKNVTCSRQNIAEKIAHLALTSHNQLCGILDWY